MDEGRRARKRIRTRQALLASALTLFAERGIYDPSIEEITAGADLGKGTFYQYFHSREALIAALVGQCVDDLLEELGEPGPRNTDRVVLLDAHETFFAKRPDVLLLFHQARGWMKLPGERHGALRAEFERYVSGLAERLGGETSHDEALGLAGFISGVLSFERILGSRPVPLRERAKEICQAASAEARGRR